MKDMFALQLPCLLADLKIFHTDGACSVLLKAVFTMLLYEVEIYVALHFSALLQNRPHIELIPVLEVFNSV